MTVKVSLSTSVSFAIKSLAANDICVFDYGNIVVISYGRSIIYRRHRDSNSTSIAGAICVGDSVGKLSGP